MNSLKPCPFCGSRYVRTEVDDVDKVFRIYCCSGDDCAAEMKLHFGDTMLGHSECFSFLEMQDIFDKMKRMWNQREG